MENQLTLTRLYVSVFVASLGLGLYIYFVPVFAQKFGATFFDLGLIGSASAVSYALTPILVGYLADRFNRAGLYIVSLGLNIIAALALLASTSVGDIILIRLLGGLAYGFFWPTAEVLVTDLAPARSRIKEMGRYSVAWAAGFLIGPYVGGIVAQDFGFGPLFIISSVVIAFAGLPSVLWVNRRYKQGTIRHVPPSYSGNLKIVRTLTFWYLMSLCYGLVFSVLASIFPGYANSLGVEPATIGLLFAAFGLARIFTFAVVEHHASRGEVRILVVASLLMALSNVIVALVPTIPGFLVALTVFGWCFGIVFPLTISLISRRFPPERLGAAIGSYETVFGVGFTIGPMLAGITAATFSSSVSFLITAFFGVLMAVFTLAGSAAQRGREE